MQNEYIEPGASPSTPLDVMDSFNNTGSSFQSDNEGLASEAGASVSVMVQSVTDTTLEQILTKMRELDKENLLLKEHLLDNNKQLRRQCDVLRTVKQKDTEKVEQFKAVISALRGEVTDFQVKLITMERKDTANEKMISLLENEKSHLMGQKALSDKRIVNMMQHAEAQGFTGLKDLDNLPDISDTVLVGSEDKENELQMLQAAVSENKTKLDELHTELATVSQQRDHFKRSNDDLLQDMRGLQTQKQQLDEEHRQLQAKNTQLSEKLDQHMQSALASARKEVEISRHTAASGGGDGLATELTELSLNKQTRGEVLSHHESSAILDDAQNLEELFETNLALQQNHKSEASLKAELELEKTEKDTLRQKCDYLSKELNCTKTDLTSAQHTIEALKQEKSQLHKEFEENLNSITHQREEKSIQRHKLSEDQSNLKLQVITLLGQVEEANNKLAAASMAIQQRDRRLTEVNEAEIQSKDQLQQYYTRIQHLDNELNYKMHECQQHRTQHNATSEQYRKLQCAFDKLVADYTELLNVEENRSREQQASRSAPQKLDRETLERLDSLAAQLCAAEEAIGYRDDQLKKYSSKLEETKDENNFLRIQLDTYCTDFQTERDSRAQISQEKNEMEEKLNKSLSENKSLTERLKLLDMQNRANASKNPNFGGVHKLYSSVNLGSPVHQHHTTGQGHGTPVDRRTPSPIQLPAHTSNTHQPYSNRLSQPQPTTELSEPDQYPSMPPHQCPWCLVNLPDQDTLQLHVADCDQQAN